MGLTDAQEETLDGISPKGFHPNEGVPCGCGAEHYTTRKEVGYSDFVTYYHKCTNCGNRFSTYIEG